MLTEIFKALFLTSCMGALLTLVLALFEPITKKHFSSRWHYYIWLVVLIVMVLPIRIDLPKKMQAQQIFAFELDVHDIIINDNTAMDIQNEVMQNVEAGQTALTVFKILSNFIEDKINIIACIWLTGAVMLLLIRIKVYITFRNNVTKNSECISCPELAAFTSRKIIVRTCDGISSPIMLGIIKPELLLPRRDITSTQLNNILAHEMTHFRRNDILYKWFATLVKCIHWFNPAIYFACRQINTWCEISCDLAVVEQMDKEGELSYVSTILALLSAGESKNIPLTTGMLGNKETLKRRFLMIKNRTDISRKAKLISSIAAVAVMVTALSASGVMANGLLADENAGDTENTAVVNVADSSNALAEDNDENAAEIEAAEFKSEVQQENVAEDVKADVADKVNKPVEAPAKEAESQTVEAVWPCPASKMISADFNSRVHPLTGELVAHNGIDIPAPEGTDVVAATAGNISDTGYDAKFGNYIKITNAAGVTTFYAHLSEIAVAEGDSVAVGQCVGRVGTTGASTGPHLHFEVIIAGENVNPRTFLGN